MTIIVTVMVMLMMTALVDLLYSLAVYAYNGFIFPANQLATDAQVTNDSLVYGLTVR